MLWYEKKTQNNGIFYYLKLISFGVVITSSLCDYILITTCPIMINSLFDTVWHFRAQNLVYTSNNIHFSYVINGVKIYRRESLSVIYLGYIIDPSLTCVGPKLEDNDG